MPTVLRPRTATELVDAAFQLLRRHYLQFVSIAAVFLIPVIVLQAWAMTPQRSAVPSPGYFFAFFVVAVLALLSTAAVTVGVSDSYVHDRVDVMYAIRRVLARIVPILLGTFATIVVIFAVMFVLVMAFTIVATSLTAAIGVGRAGGVTAIVGTVLGFAGVALGFLSTYARIFAVPMVIVLEGTSVGTAFTRSLSLTEGAVWRIMGVFVLVFFIFAAFLGLMLMAGTMITMQYARLVTAYSVLAGTINVFVYPIYTVFVTLLYYDLRIRRDGFDLEMMSKELVGRSAPATA